MILSSKDSVFQNSRAFRQAIGQHKREIEVPCNNNNNNNKTQPAKTATIRQACVQLRPMRLQDGIRIAAARDPKDGKASRTPRPTLTKEHTNWHHWFRSAAHQARGQRPCERMHARNGCMQQMHATPARCHHASPRKPASRGRGGTRRPHRMARGRCTCKKEKSALTRRAPPSTELEKGSR
jgi:hypothetical protein